MNGSTEARRMTAGYGELVEEGVSEIELAASQTFNRSYEPLNGQVKWFKDGLGQLWVKFRSGKRNRDFEIYKYVDRVWPANRVVQVIYEKDSPS